MKKRVLALMGAGLLVAALAGCSSSKPAETTAAPAATEAPTEAAAEETEAEAEAPAEEAEAEVPDIDFPKKDIHIICPYDAGGGVDITTRLVADAAGKDYFKGHSLIVEDMPGG